MIKSEVKHGGCAVCKSKDQEILSSVKVPGEVMGKAVCDVCLKKIEDNQKRGWKIL